MEKTCKKPIKIKKSPRKVFLKKTGGRIVYFCKKSRISEGLEAIKDGEFASILALEE